MASIIIISLTLLVGLLLFLIFKRQRSESTTKSTQPLLLMQRHVESLRTDVRNSLPHITENVAQQLAMITQQIQSQTNAVESHLDNAARVGHASNTQGIHLDHACKKYEEADKRLSDFEGRLENITEHTLTDGRPTRPVEEQKLLI